MNIMWAVEHPGPFGEPWVSAHATKASALVNAANWGRDVQVVDVAAMPAAEFAALSARVAKLEALARAVDAYRSARLLLSKETEDDLVRTWAAEAATTYRFMLDALAAVEAKP